MAKRVDALASCRVSHLALNHGPKGLAPRKFMHKPGSSEVRAMKSNNPLDK